MLIKRKGQWVDVNSEPEEEEPVEERDEREPADFSDDIGSMDAEMYFGTEGQQRKGEGEAEWMERIERENPDAIKYRREHGDRPLIYNVRDEEGDAKDKQEWEEANKRVDETLRKLEEEERNLEEEQRKEDAGVPVAKTRAERIAEKIEIQKQKVELAELRKQEIAAGGGGVAGLIKRTVSSTRREVSREVSRGRTPSRGQRARPGRLIATGKKNYGLYAVPGARKMVTPTGIKTTRGARTRPQGDGLSALRNATMPSGTGRSDLFKPSSIGRSDLLKPASIGGTKPMGLGKVPDNLKPARFDAKYMKPMGLNTAKMSTAKLGLSAKGNMLKPAKLDFKKGQSKLMGGAVKKKVSNRQYNKNMKRLLKMQRL